MSGSFLHGIGDMPSVSWELGGCWESVHRPCLSPTHASNWQMHYRSTYCALILPRHLHWLGPIFHGQRMAPFLSYHNHLGLSAWCMPCLIPLPGLPVLSAKSPAGLALRSHPSCQLCWSSTSWAGLCLICLLSPTFLPSLLQSWSFPLFLDTVPHLDCCIMRTYKRENQAQRDDMNCSGQHSNQMTTVPNSLPRLLCRQLYHTLLLSLTEIPQERLFIHPQFSCEDTAAQRG